MPVMGRVPPTAEQKQSPQDKELLAKLTELRQEALTDRKRYEPTWHLCQSFLAGRQWIGWNPRTQRIVELPNPQDRERHTANVITPYHSTSLGKLYGEDLRPPLTFTRSDEEGESIAAHTRKVADFIWSSEVDGDKRAYFLIHKELTYGTSALRCYFDGSQGSKIGEFPIGPDGRAVTDLVAARNMVAQAQQQGIQLQYTSLNEGRTCWEVLSPFNIIPPPGIEDPEYFPTLFIERPMSVEAVKLRWPDAPDDLKEEDLRVADARELSTDPWETIGSPSGAGRLKGHVMVITYFCQPTRAYENGHTVTFIEQQILEQSKTLPYNLRGKPHHGVFFTRFHLVDGRFWGKGVVEDLIGPQRQRNKARSQMIEMKDRNLGRVYARKGTLTPSNVPVGKIMELIEIPMHADWPQETQGVPPGPWIENEARINDEDMQRVAGLGDVSRGQVPQGVSAYASLALLAQEDDRRIGPAIKTLRGVLADAMLVSLEIAKNYWRDDRQLAVVGTDGAMDEFIYRRSLLPAQFYVSLAKNSPLPTDPAAEAQRIFDIFNAAISCGQPLPPEWLKESLDAGRALPFPKREGQVQQKKAQMENYLLRQAEMVIPDPFDDDQIHLQVHRAERWAQMNVPGMEVYVQYLEQHEKLHEQAMMQKQLGAQPTAGGLPQAQGMHGIEAQNAPHVNQQGAAQTASGQTPVSMPGAQNGGAPGY